jgi:hypothetical protein
VLVLAAQSCSVKGHALGCMLDSHYSSAQAWQLSAVATRLLGFLVMHARQDAVGAN